MSPHNVRPELRLLVGFDVEWIRTQLRAGHDYKSDYYSSDYYSQIIKSGYRQTLNTLEKWLDELPTPPTTAGVIALLEKCDAYRTDALDAMIFKCSVPERCVVRGRYEALTDLSDLIVEELSALGVTAHGPKKPNAALQKVCDEIKKLIAECWESSDRLGELAAYDCLEIAEKAKRGEL